MSDAKFVSSRKATKILGVCADTLRRMDRDGQIQTIRLPGGNRIYNVEQFIEENSSPIVSSSPDKVQICYCRVSSRQQKDDLERQVQFMQEKYPNHTIIKDIGSGLNFKRKGLKRILDLAFKGNVGEVVVAYKDRLARFGFELIEYVLKQQSDARVVVLNEADLSPEEELTKDLLQILTVFSARNNGFRKYRNKVKADKTLSERKSEKDT